jgi:hypothetical protein
VPEICQKLRCHGRLIKQHPHRSKFRPFQAQVPNVDDNQCCEESGCEISGCEIISELDSKPSVRQMPLHVVSLCRRRFISHWHVFPSKHSNIQQCNWKNNIPLSCTGIGIDSTVCLTLAYRKPDSIVTIFGDDFQ